MGAQISSLHRLRRKLLIHAYMHGNAGYDSIQNVFIARFPEGGDELTKNDLIAAFPTLKASIVYLFQFYCFERDRIPATVVLRFLETGRIPIGYNPNPRIIVKTPIPMTTCRTFPLQREAKMSQELILHGNTSKDASSSVPTTTDTDFWKKHETVITEKIVRHLTVKNGIRSELIETDKSQNEIVHIECSSSGDFAHREYSQQEQTEELDNEITTFIRATEEYVHFKNEDDEYEYLHSNIPSADGANDEDSINNGDVCDP
jgi:hypothetical protein